MELNKNDLPIKYCFLFGASYSKKITVINCISPTVLLHFRNDLNCGIVQLRNGRFCVIPFPSFLEWPDICKSGFIYRKRLVSLLENVVINQNEKHRVPECIRSISDNKFTNKNVFSQLSWNFRIVCWHDRISLSLIVFKYN